MPEIKTPLLHLVEGQPYEPKAGDIVIPRSASIADILRHIQRELGEDSLEKLEMEVEDYIRSNQSGS